MDSEGPTGPPVRPRRARHLGHQVVDYGVGLALIGAFTHVATSRGAWTIALAGAVELALGATLVAPLAAWPHVRPRLHRVMEGLVAAGLTAMAILLPLGFEVRLVDLFAAALSLRGALTLRPTASLPSAPLAAGAQPAAAAPGLLSPPTGNPPTAPSGTRRPSATPIVAGTARALGYLAGKARRRA